MCIKQKPAICRLWAGRRPRLLDPCSYHITMIADSIDNDTEPETRNATPASDSAAAAQWDRPGLQELKIRASGLSNSS